MAGVSADDMLDPDELEMAQVGELLADELPETPARPVASASTEEDEFADLLTEEEELPATPATVVAAAVDSTDMLADLETTPTPSLDEDEFAGLDIPGASVEPEAAPEPAPAPVAVADTSLDDLDSLDTEPTAAEVAPETEAVAAEAPDLDSLDDLGPAEPAAPVEATPGPPTDDPFEVTSATENSISSARSSGAKKGAQTRKENAEKLKQQTDTPAAESAPQATPEAETPALPTETVITLGGTDAHIQFTKPVVGQAFPGSRSLSDREERFFRAGQDEPEGAIDRALKAEAEQYGEVTDRDLYFYRAGIAEGMRHGTTSQFITKPS